MKSDIFSHYNMELVQYSYKTASTPPEMNGHVVKLVFRAATFGMGIEDDEMLRDLSLMNKIREQSKTDPAVQDAYEKLLTVMALMK